MPTAFAMDVAPSRVPPSREAVGRARRVSRRRVASERRAVDVPATHEVRVDEPYDHRALTDGRGDALDGAAAHVAGGEDPGPAGLEQGRLAAVDAGRRT